MKTPKYIKNAIEQRAKHAERYNHYDDIVSDWVIKNGIDAEYDDICSSIESIVHPWETAESLLKTIEDA